MLVKCVRKVHAGELWFEKALTQTFLSGRTVKVSRRESELINLVSQGLKNKEIATVMGVTEGTVKVYLSRLFGKIGARDRFRAGTHRAAQRAQRNGFLQHAAACADGFPGRSRLRRCPKRGNRNPPGCSSRAPRTKLEPPCVSGSNGTKGDRSRICCSAVFPKRSFWASFSFSTFAQAAVVWVGVSYLHFLTTLPPDAVLEVRRDRVLDLSSDPEPYRPILPPQLARKQAAGGAARPAGRPQPRRPAESGPGCTRRLPLRRCRRGNSGCRQCRRRIALPRRWSRWICRPPWTCIRSSGFPRLCCWHPRRTTWRPSRSSRLRIARAPWKFRARWRWRCVPRCWMSAPGTRRRPTF